MTSTVEQSDPFFMDDPRILVAPARLTEFFPSKDMSIQERFNALARLALYSSTAIALYKNSFKPLHYGAVLLVVLVVLWKYQTVTKTEFFSPGVLTDTMPVVLPNKLPCRMPTLENPMMNPLYGDTVDMPGACQGPGVQETALALLDKQLIENPEDLFGAKQMQRNFYTLPSTTIVDDREKHQNWLFRDAPNCKVDASACYYDDLKLQREFPVSAENDYSELPTLNDERIL